MNIHESAEDYLEAILKLREDHGMVRSIDIVHELGFSKPRFQRTIFTANVVFSTSGMGFDFFKSLITQIMLGGGSRRQDAKCSKGNQGAVEAHDKAVIGADTHG